MKLRLRENSIRLRLLQSEVRKLKETGTISELIIFGAAQNLTYTLSISQTAKETTARFANAEIIVEIPQDLSNEWLTSEHVGLEHQQKIGENLTLKILIEKDFVCLDRPFDPDTADAFPHPNLKC